MGETFQVEQLGEGALNPHGGLVGVGALDVDHDQVAQPEADLLDVAAVWGGGFALGAEAGAALGGQELLEVALGCIGRRVLS